jgi:hypothetical protein
LRCYINSNLSVKVVMKEISGNVCEDKRIEVTK